MISNKQGDLLRANADALVNTVNTTGVMGKGIALQFKRAYPEMFRDYERAAKRGEIQIGRMHVWATGHLSGPRYIINFPTKSHWRSRSRIEDISSGLVDLQRVIVELGISSLALPPLGCGNGGLAWRDVEPVIKSALERLDSVEILLFTPKGPPGSKDLRTNESLPKMTVGRAALVAILDRYTRQALAAPSLIETQKLMYFLQNAGQPLRLVFAANRYGPYADNLRHTLKAIEGHYIIGFGDGSTPVQEAEPIRVLPSALGPAHLALSADAETAGRIDRVLNLVEGFESSYGLELLASVHWLVATDMQVSTSRDSILTQLQRWSPRKAQLFTTAHVNAAFDALGQRGWLASTSTV